MQTISIRRSLEWHVEGAAAVETIAYQSSLDTELYREYRNFNAHHTFANGLGTLLE